VTNSSLVFFPKKTRKLQFIYIKEENRKIRSLEDMATGRIAVVKGYGTIPKLKKKFPKMVVVETPDLLTAINAVLNNDVDAFLEAQMVAEKAILDNAFTGLKGISQTVFKASPMHYFSRIDEPILASILQKGLDAVSSEERSDILRKWFTLSTGDKNKVKLTPQEQSWIALHPDIRLGVDIAWPPFEFVEDGLYKGIGASYVKWVSEQLGLHMEPATQLTWQQVIERSKRKELDILPAVMQTQEREKFLNFTKPYIKFPMVIATRTGKVFANHLKDLYGKKVGVVKGYVTEDILRRNHPKIELAPSTNLVDALKALSSGQVYAVFDNLGVITYQLEQLKIDNIKIAAATEYNFELAMGVRKDWPELVTILDKTLAFMEEEKHAAIRNSWLAVEVNLGTDIKTILKWAIPIGIVVIVIITMITWWNRRMGQEISERQQAQDELARERKLLEAVLESIQQGLVAYDKNLRLIICNSRYQEIRGVSDEFAKPGTAFADWIRYEVEKGEFGTENTEEQVRYHMDRAENFRSHHFDRVRPNGTVIHVEGGALPGGGFVSTFTDITARKQAEQHQADLLREINFQKFALDQHAIVSITDANGNITYMNDHFCEISGFSRDEVMGKNHRVLKSDEHSPEFYKEMWQTIKNGETWHGEVKNAKKAGGYYWVSATIVPFLDEYSKPFQYISIRTDITERKDAELEMKKLSTAVEESPASVIITNVDGIIEYADVFVFEKACF
jgi:PAS domain S-box-containing protein